MVYVMLFSARTARMCSDDTLTAMLLSTPVALAVSVANAPVTPSTRAAVALMTV